MAKKVSWHDQTQILPPLNHSNSEIRILQIKPGFPDSPIRCAFHVTSLNNLDVSYEALSYAWGTASQNATHEDIYLGDDDDDSNKVGVTPPLANALRRLRLLNEPRNVWADALCINQADDHEKSLQVTIMGRIYSNCAQGAIWVGPLDDVPEEDAQAALDTISWIAGEQEAHPWMEVSDNEEDSDEEDEEEEGGDDDCEDEGESEQDNDSEEEDQKTARLKRESAAAAFKTLFHLPWWSRIWTVQEAILPPLATLYWGPCQIPWSTLDKASESFFNDSAPNVPDEFWHNSAIESLTVALRGLGASREEELFMLLWRWRHRKATDPRDKVYGLLGFRHDVSLPSVKTCDYTVDVRTLYHKVTVDLINISTDLQPLLGRGGERSEIPGLASWAVDWDGVRDVSKSSKCSFWDHHHWWHFGGFTADRGMYGVGEGLRVEGDGHVLRVTGLRLSKIDMVEDNVPEDIEVSEEVSVAALYRLYGNRWGELMTRYHKQFPDKLLSGGMVAFLSLVTGNLVSDGSEDNNEIAEWVQKMLRTHVLFITDDGRLGMGPRNVRPGQELWIVGGCRIPVILNILPKASDKESEVSVTFHSECFVYGIMSGEAVEGRGDQVVEILLR
ncbi:heterokaryon incompatibility domain-containing protein [Trichoderma sp. SZMC 28014]